MRKFVLLAVAAIFCHGCNQSAPKPQAVASASQQNSTEIDTMQFDTLKAAAENGNAKAQLSLGYAYDVGRGVEQNLKSAAHWYQKAGAQGEPNAQFNYAEMLRDGAGVPQSSENALDWYTKAAMQGHSKAQYNIAMMYVEGEGVASDNVTAYAWLVLASAGDAVGADQALKIVGDGIGERITDGKALAQKLKAEIGNAE